MYISVLNLSSWSSTVLQHIYFALFDNAIQMHSIYDLSLPSSYNRAPNASSVFFTFSYACSLFFFPVLNRRDTSVSIDYRTRNGDYAGVVIDQSCTGCIGRVRSSQRAALSYLCGVIFLRCARVQLPVDGYVRVFLVPQDLIKMEILYTV